MSKFFLPVFLIALFILFLFGCTQSGSVCGDEICSVGEEITCSSDCGIILDEPIDLNNSTPINDSNFNTQINEDLDENYTVEDLEKFNEVNDLWGNNSTEVIEETPDINSETIIIEMEENLFETSTLECNDIECSGIEKSMEQEKTIEKKSNKTNTNLVYFNNLGTWNPKDAIWRILQKNGTTTTKQFGWSKVIPVPADYDGDKKTDLAVFNPNDTTWYILKSSGGGTTIKFGDLKSTPVPADYDGDKKADLATYLNGKWQIKQSTTGKTITKSFGWSATKPVPADYTGNGKTDLAVFNPNDTTWYVHPTGLKIKFGDLKSTPIPADYDGDKKADLATYLNGKWQIKQSTTGKTITKSFGWSATKPVTTDYDGDEITDIVLYHPEKSTWYILKSSGGSLTITHGVINSIPVPGTYQGVTADCTSFTYSEWSECQDNGTQTRTVLTSTPKNCQAGNPLITQTCTAPIKISSCEDLNKVREHPDKNYILTNDIDCSAFGDFEPLPRYGGRLTSGVKVAVFDGQNHTISNITIRRPYKKGTMEMTASLFEGIGNLGMTSSYTSVYNPSIVKNLRLKNVTLSTPIGASIDGYTYNYFNAAPLTYSLAYGRTDKENSIIDNVIIENINYDINIADSPYSNLDTKSLFLAGITISNGQYTTISNSKVIGKITHNFYGNNTKPLLVSFGGISNSTRGTIINSTFELSNNITFDENSTIGGIVKNTSGFYNITNSINKTNLSGGIVGGIAANSLGSGNITNSKNYGNINATKSGGGLVGELSVTLPGYNGTSTNYLTNSTNEGNISGSNDSNLGGIAGVVLSIATYSQYSGGEYGRVVIEGSCNNGAIEDNQSISKNHIIGFINHKHTYSGDSGSSLTYRPNTIELKNVLVNCTSDCLPTAANAIDNNLSNCQGIRLDIPCNGKCLE